MFNRIGALTTRFRWSLIAIAVAVVAVGATWGTTVFASLTSGGNEDPNSESARARTAIVNELGPYETDIVALYSSREHQVNDPEFKNAVQAIEEKLDHREEVASVISYYRTGAPSLIADDQHATYLAITLRNGDEDRKSEDFEALKDDLDATGLTTRLGGSSAIFADVSEQVEKDLMRAELFSMPVLLLLLMVIFGSAVAALMPLIIGGIAIVGSFLVLKVLSYFTDISIFAINVITILGLGLAIDYALFVVSRFREELRAGYQPNEAVRRTMRTAGRTVAVSALVVALSLAGLLIFPQVFLRSMGLGGIAAVLVALTATLTVLPATLALLGHRIDAGKMPWRRRVNARSSNNTDGRWARFAQMVMRRPWIFVLGSLALLLFLAQPATHITFGGIDERVLPENATSRQVSEAMARDFPSDGGKTITIFLRGTTPADATRFAERLPDEVSGVTQAQVVKATESNSLISVGYHGTSSSEQARDTVNDIRALTPPAGEMMVTGAPADLVDLVDGISERLPWMLAMMATVTFVLLFLAFGSIVLPLKAIIMNVISLGAAFGVVVWVFQDGHLSDFLGFTPMGDIEATQPILMLAILFGLSMDYEVFLLSRIREQWDATGDNKEAITRGLQHTGGIITSAAALLMIVIVGFAAGGITFIKMIGVGMLVAIAVDATIVRAILVPAVMRLFGNANWWLPKPLARAYARYGISETDSELDTVQEPSKTLTPV
ncbi:MAG: MMPL family transporter [Corynebacteriales bacterium]|nr:MMPL family transporter [Mycobacteriales bacterium]